MKDRVVTMPVVFKWVSVQPDPRPYKPGNPLLLLEDTKIQIDVPVDNKYIKNTNDILAMQLGVGELPKPVLTPLGMKYCIDQFEAVMVDTKPIVEDEDEKWEDEKPSNKPEKSPKKTDDWDDEEGDDGDDKWNDEEEDW